MGVLQKLVNTFFSKPLSEETLYKLIEQSLIDQNRRYGVSQLLARAALHFAHNPALITSHCQMSYHELYFRSLLFSKKITELGVKPRDKVLVLFENSIEFYIAYFAILQCGGVCVPLNIFLHEKELAYIIADAQPFAVVASGLFKEKIQGAAGLLKNGSFPLVISDDAFDWMSTPPATFEEVDSIFRCTALDDDELSLLLYTSGTTGVPKGVMLSSTNVMTNVSQCMARLSILYKITQKTAPHNWFFSERFFAALPLFHVFAQNTCIWFPFLIGASIIVVPRIDRREILEGLTNKPTFFFGVPALYGLLSLLKTAPLDSVKFFVSGGDALPDKIRAAFAMVYGRKICSGYGLTEASPVVAVNVENEESAAAVVGAPLYGIKIDIRNENGVSLPSGTVGTLWISSKNVMLGYYNAPQESAKVLQSGWLNTGDLASCDEATGKLSIVGRSKDLIIHKGFNIYPQEVENILLSHPSVFQAAVVGREDATSGQVPIAFVSLKSDKGSGNDLDKMLRDFCSNHLASYKIPRKFIYLEDLPLNATGKVDKKRLVAD